MKPTTHYFRQNLGGILYLLDDPVIHYFKDSLMGKPTIVVGWWPNVWSIPTPLIPLSFQIMAIVDQHQPTHMWPKNNVKHFQWMKAENPNLALWLNCWRHGVSSAPKNLFSCFFIFSLFFFVLQVIVEGSWWADFSDGTWSRLLNGDSLWDVWIMTLQGDWWGDFKGAKGQKE